MFGLKEKKEWPSENIYRVPEHVPDRQCGCDVRNPPIGPCSWFAVMQIQA
jgi:hypothetical protein